jgi:hypothetical protein
MTIFSILHLSDKIHLYFFSHNTVVNNIAKIKKAMRMLNALRMEETF